jgi:hypothetical protein
MTSSELASGSTPASSSTTTEVALDESGFGSGLSSLQCILRRNADGLV